MVMETIKLSGLFILVFTIMRLLGKTLLSQWTAYDLVTIIFLSYAALGAVNIQGFLHAVICITIIGGFYMLLSRVSLNEQLRHFIIGHPTILIKDGEIIQKNLKQLRYSLTELLSTVRSAGYPDIQGIQYAILEPNGEISVLPKNNLRPLTPKDLNLDIEHSDFPITVIEDGNIKHENLIFINKTEEWLKRELEQNEYYDIRSIFYAYVKYKKKSLIIFPYN
ncbi:DUF421 domain-containing protein [Desertibacillus haloalkaliphilus]|uniref:DUF421 domain-containing protein n=1 Tax=Desertibacillus haloalkaliphilus TaxID=1328930 RepID=UPI001C254048|nr:DUF421 domain-containing protein [Desertibacillus haloalkaliphilus]MBU8908133.1 DUF421 domain-containing protein [Desertibacillus haloalkaliphilus]